MQGVDTPEPILQLDSNVFRGVYEGNIFGAKFDHVMLSLHINIDIPGTFMIFAPTDGKA